MMSTTMTTSTSSISEPWSSMILCEPIVSNVAIEAMSSLGDGPLPHFPFHFGGGGGTTPFLRSGALGGGGPW